MTGSSNGEEAGGDGRKAQAWATNAAAKSNPPLRHLETLILRVWATCCVGCGGCGWGWWVE